MGEENAVSVGRWAGKRALSTPTAAVIMIVVILVVGGLGYVGLNSSGAKNESKSTCVPATSPACVAATAAHDVTLAVPYKSVQEGSVVPYTASLPNGESATSFTFDFGDGSTPVTQASPSASHVYTTPGSYIASATAVVRGATHDSYLHLVPIQVTASFAAASAGNVPAVSGVIVTNSSPVSGTPATAILQSGDTITVRGTYTSAPTNPLFSLNPPTVVGPTGITPTNPSNTNTSATATFSFTTSGIYQLTFVGSASATGSPTAYQNFTWSVFVAATGLHASAGAAVTAKSPHPGHLVVYELAPGGSGGEDPAIEYETLGYEPIENIYQTLIFFNGSQTGPTFTSYVPTIATCVPGSNVGANNCQSMYGSTLISGDNYTFVIGAHSQFYDPISKNHWGVYPTDVVFSVLRTMAFATIPCVGCNNGWILSQALLSSGNGTWNSIHGVLNNTPSNMWNSMTINGTDCPAAAMTNDHGCVTFHANANGVSWPYFLELIADPLGASIVPAGWFSASAQGAGIPYWTAGNVSGTGDHPVPVPGTAGYGVDLTTISPTAWDQYETDGSQPPFIGTVQWAMAGSGPYYLANLQQTLSYALSANPAYASNPKCTWTGCFPSPGQYVGDVSVTWETTQVPGEQAYAAGTADLASIPSTDTAFELQLIAQGKIVATTFPSISIDFYPFNFGFDKAAAQHYTANPITVPSDWFSHVGMREFFAHAYPYATIQQTINVVGGIQRAFNYGGAIPQFMANYYPSNVSFPTGDPITDPSVVDGAAWWWAQITNPSSQYYDSETTACTVASPCQLPLFGQTGAPDLDQRIALWVAEIVSLTGGKVVPNPLDINFIDAVINSLYLGPYANPMPVYRLGWAPDYPDPTDYVNPLYRPDNTYTLGDVVAEQTSLTQFNDPSCHISSDYTWWSNQASNPGTGGVADKCQGSAYGALIAALDAAAIMPAGAQRVLTYAEAEQIANALALYVYSFQQNVVVTTASWIDPTSYNSNVTSGGGADSTWFTITGNSIL